MKVELEGVRCFQPRHDVMVVLLASVCVPPCIHMRIGILLQAALVLGYCIWILFLRTVLVQLIQNSSLTLHHIDINATHPVNRNTGIKVQVRWGSLHIDKYLSSILSVHSY